jgi:uncharacterized membrane protein YbhN (UPF0104 family)
MMAADPLLLSLAVLASIALDVGGVWRIIRQADRRRGVLMIVAALVLLGNVLIWAWPVRS